MNLRLTVVLALTFAFFSLGMFSYAQTPNLRPTIEVCGGTDCNPDVALTMEVVMVTKDTGSIPGDLTYKRGSVVRIHAEITDPGGVNYANVIIEDQAGSEIAIIPLFNDGSAAHGDEAGLTIPYADPVITNGDQDDIYSNYWSIPYKFPTGATNPYYFHIEAADNFAQDQLDFLHVYKTINDNPIGYEIEFFLTDACLATCGTLGNYRCSNGVREICVYDPNNDCNAWEADYACPGGYCCGPTDTPNATDIICCGAGANNCDASGNCQACDNTCTGGLPDCNTGCPPALDPDCNPLGCCGDGVCDPLIGENPGNCLSDCPDNTPPTIVINTFILSSLSETSLFQIEANIVDDWNEIASNPTAVITDLGGGTTYRNVPLINIPGTNDFLSSVIDPTISPAMGQGDYLVTVTARDTVVPIPNINIASESFYISCANECTIPNQTSCNSNTQETCSMGGDGCYDIVPTDCTNPADFPITLPGAWGLCRNDDCCEENCNTSDPSVCVNNTDLSACITQTDGCNRSESGLNCPTFLSNPSAVCRTNSGGDGNCCIDACVLNDTQCNGINSAVETCAVNTDTGCNHWVEATNCGTGTCKDTGSGGATCCDDTCSAVDANITCGGAGSVWTIDCQQDPATHCFYQAQNTDCLASFPPNGDCRMNTSTSHTNCCNDDCQPSDPQVCVGEVLSGCNALVSPDGCYDYSSGTDCAIPVNGHCREIPTTPGDYNCCVDVCNIGDPVRCGATGIETCQLNNASGCNHWVETVEQELVKILAQADQLVVMILAVRWTLT